MNLWMAWSFIPTRLLNTDMKMGGCAFTAKRAAVMLSVMIAHLRMHGADERERRDAGLWKHVKAHAGQQARAFHLTLPSLPQVHILVWLLSQLNSA